jgi:hypothetical protein
VDAKTTASGLVIEADLWRVNLNAIEVH